MPAVAVGRVVPTTAVVTAAPVATQAWLGGPMGPVRVATVKEARPMRAAVMAPAVAASSTPKVILLWTVQAAPIGRQTVEVEAAAAAHRAEMAATVPIPSAVVAVAVAEPVHPPTTSRASAISRSDRALSVAPPATVTSSFSPTPPRQMVSEQLSEVVPAVDDNRTAVRAAMSAQLADQS